MYDENTKTKTGCRRVSAKNEDENISVRFINSVPFRFRVTSHTLYVFLLYTYIVVSTAGAPSCARFADSINSPVKRHNRITPGALSYIYIYDVRSKRPFIKL